MSIIYWVMFILWWNNIEELIIIFLFFQHLLHQGMGFLLCILARLQQLRSQPGDHQHHLWHRHHHHHQHHQHQHNHHHSHHDHDHSHHDHYNLHWLLPNLCNLVMPFLFCKPALFRSYTLCSTMTSGGHLKRFSSSEESTKEAWTNPKSQVLRRNKNIWVKISQISWIQKVVQRWF